VCNVEWDPEHERTAGFSTADLQILEFNLTERKVPGSTSDRLCMAANVYRNFYRSKFSNPCSRFVGMTYWHRYDPSFPLTHSWVTLWRELKSDQGKKEGKFTAVECWAVDHPFASVVICVGQYFAPSHHLSALSVYYRSRWRGGRLTAFLPWPNDRHSIWYW
jgi:hypothetical protein